MPARPWVALADLPWEGLERFAGLPPADKLLPRQIAEAIVPLNAFSTGLWDHLATVNGAKAYEEVFRTRRQEHLLVLNAASRYRQKTRTLAGDGETSPGADLKQILAFAGQLIGEPNTALILWPLTAGYIVSLTFAMLSMGPLEEREPLLASILALCAQEASQSFAVALELVQKFKRGWKQEYCQKQAEVQHQFIAFSAEQFFAGPAEGATVQLCRQLGYDLPAEYAPLLAAAEAKSRDLILPDQRRMADTLHAVTRRPPPVAPVSVA